MIKTKITEMLGIKYPLLGGTMMNISFPEFVAACSNAGGLGILGSVMYRKPELLREAIRELQSLTDNPFAVNVTCRAHRAPVYDFKQGILCVDADFMDAVVHP